MDQNWIQIVVILMFIPNIATGAVDRRVIKEKEPVQIKCGTNGFSSTFVWFRVLDTSAMEFIAIYNLVGEIKSSPASLSSIFSHEKSKSYTLTLKSFNKARDSGIYVCACQKSQELIFGSVIQLVGEEQVKVLTKAPPDATKTTPCTTAAPCVCNYQTEKGTSPLMLCSPIILGPLVGSCGLLLLLLIITTLYCKKTRTRHCPHHHKRKPRAMPPGKQMKTSRQM